VNESLVNHQRQNDGTVMLLEGVRCQYGSSTSLCDYIVLHQLELLRPKDVVDFGAGAGKNGRLVRRALGEACRIIGVEGFSECAKMLAGQGEYDRVDAMLLQDWISRESQHYSVAIFGDVLEHIKPREIHKVLRRCIRKFDHIIIVAPLHDIYQDDAYGNPLEIHRTYITQNFFDRYKPVEKHIVHGEEFTMVNLLISTRRTSDKWYRRCSRRLFHIIVLSLQPFGLARVFVNCLKRSANRYKWLLR
jgi:hypothetical protein